MDNVSKALLIAGAVFIAVMLITLIMWFLNVLRNYSYLENMNTKSVEIESMNRYFLYIAPNDSEITGVDAFNAFNKAWDINQTFPQYPVEVNDNGTVSFAGYSFRTNMNFNTYNSYVESINDRDNMSKVEQLKKSRYSYSYSMDETGRINRIYLNKKS